MKVALIICLVVCSMFLVTGSSDAGYGSVERATTAELGKLWRQQFEMPVFSGIRFIFGSKSVEKKLGERELNSVKTLVDVMKTVPEIHLNDEEIGKICYSLYYDTGNKSNEELGEMVLQMLSVKKALLPQFEKMRSLPRINTLELGTTIRKILSGEGTMDEQGKLFTQFIQTQLITEIALKRSGQEIKKPSDERFGKLTREFVSKYIRFKLSFSKSSYDKEFGELALPLFEEGARAKLYYSQFV